MVLVLAAYGTPDQSAAGAEQTGFNSSSIGGSMMVRGLGTVIYHVAGLNRAKTWYTQASNNNLTSTSRSTSVAISEGTNLGSILISR